MVKKILVITYSQSGQLDAIVDNVLSGIDGDIQVAREKLKPVPDYPFPWKDIHFWDAQPECVELIPAGLQPLSFDPDADYDLVVLGYPIWFLSPPTPLTSFLKSEAARVLNKKNVISIIGCRNMWAGAQEDVKKLIALNGGNLVGNIVLRDKHHNLPSVVTIIYWMTSGKKDRMCGIFPPPGVSDKDIADSKRFGAPIAEAIKKDDFVHLQEELLELKAVQLQPEVLSLERKGKKIFGAWSKFIRKKGGPGDPARIPRLKIFKWYLLTVIFLATPIANLVFWITYPIFYFSIRRNLRYYSGVSLNK